MAILSKGCQQDLWITQGLRLNFVECDSFLESNSPDIFALCETNLDDSIDSGKFSVKGFCPLFWKGSFTHMGGLAVYEKEGLSFAQYWSLENSADSYLCLWLVLLFFLLLITFIFIHGFIIFPSRTNLKLHDIYVSVKLDKKVITNLDSSKASGPDCFPVVFLKNF